MTCLFLFELILHADDRLCRADIPVDYFYETGQKLIHKYHVKVNRLSQVIRVEMVGVYQQSAFKAKEI